MRKNITIAAIALSSGLTYAQPGPPEPGGGGRNAPTPFGFVELIIGAGALYGGKKAWDAKKNKEA